MPDTAEELAASLSQQGARCPFCGQTNWGAPLGAWPLPQADDPSENLPLLRALCLSCGFLAWFQQHVPEVFIAT